MGVERYHPIARYVAPRSKRGWKSDPQLCTDKRDRVGRRDIQSGGVEYLGANRTDRLIEENDDRCRGGIDQGAVLRIGLQHHRMGKGIAA
jgi:hypothetical protein